jgi:hypothetical protein
VRDDRRTAANVARAAAGFDLLATGCLAVPGLEQRFLDALAALGFATPAVALPPLGLFLANLAGALGVLWALVRIARPEPRLVRADAIARCAVEGLIAHAIVVRGARPVLYAFVATELAGAAAQAWALPRLRR